ncbi:MAG: DUF192 domain-containing protein [Nanoarchaeota archaeon]|nr:DUF192 domain-containing protein [Nanoarchaeota archaeon]
MKIKFIVMSSLIITINLFIISCNGNTEPQVCISGNCVNVEIADTQNERNFGLMFRENLDENSGMIFIYEESDTYAFWMKNTLIQLDMIWINEDKIIIYIAEAEPCKADPCPTYAPEEPAKYILEVNQGFSQEHDINVGDKVKSKGI